MSFDTRENSLADGRPIRLYDFRRGLRHWCYTSADRSISFGGRTYLPAGISDDGIRQTGETSADAFVITGAATMEVGKLFRGAPPSSDVWLTVRDMHADDSDAVVSWIGLIKDVGMPSPDRYQITCNSLAASLDRPGLRLTWGRSCPHALGDRNCGIELDLYRVSGTVLLADGASVTVNAAQSKPDGYYSGGVIGWYADPESGEIETRGIESHVGALLTLLGGTDGLLVGSAVSIHPGCDLSAAACLDKYGNTDNLGGVPGLPGKSPFDGTQAF